MAHAVRCVTQPSDEVLTFAPYFPEYNPYVNGLGAVLINTPNNPSGVVYSEETLKKLASNL